MEQADEEVRRLSSALQAGLSEVHSVVQTKTAVPTNQVYVSIPPPPNPLLLPNKQRLNVCSAAQPQFMSLACTWEALEAQAVVISRAANLHRRLEAYTQV